jgi:hypothetical protein
MSWRRLERRIRMDIARGILLVGLTSAVAVYFTAGKPALGPLGDPLEDSKVFRRSMEMYGGKANLVASEILESFKSLWHGKPLAFILAFLTLVAVGSFLLITEEWRPDESGPPY